jgi:predicted nucleotidyltransferase
MNLSINEQSWLAAYRQELARQFAGLIQKIMVFGSKARNQSTKDSDLDLLILIRDGDWRVKDAVAQPGYLLALDWEVVPSILIYTSAEWEQRRRHQAPFWQMVNRDGVLIG